MNNMIPISFGSVIISIIIILFLTLYIEFVLRSNFSSLLSESRFIFLGVILLCIRTCIPSNFPFTITIPISKGLHLVNNVLMYPVIYNFRLYHLIWGVWIIGFILQLMKFIVTYKKQYALVKQASLIEHNKKAQIKKYLSKYSSRDIDIAIISSPISPAICGIFHPILILPDFKFTEDELNFIICHEITHYIKHDLVIKLILEICACFYWWNPIIYLLKREFYLAVEMANDFSIIHKKDKEFRLKYMQCLVNCGKFCSEKNFKKITDSTTIAFVKSVSNLELRISKMLNHQEASSHILYKAVNYFILLTAIICGILIVPESSYLPSEIEENTFSIDSDNAYFIKSNGSYKLYIDNEYVTTFTEIDNTLLELPIYEK